MGKKTRESAFELFDTAETARQAALRINKETGTPGKVKPFVVRIPVTESPKVLYCVASSPHAGCYGAARSAGITINSCARDVEQTLSLPELQQQVEALPEELLKKLLASLSRRQKR